MLSRHEHARPVCRYLSPPDEQVADRQKQCRQVERRIDGGRSASLSNYPGPPIQSTPTHYPLSTTHYGDQFPTLFASISPHSNGR
jgi:hypothetical protein